MKFSKEFIKMISDNHLAKVNYYRKGNHYGVTYTSKNEEKNMEKHGIFRCNKYVIYNTLSIIHSL